MNAIFRTTIVFLSGAALQLAAASMVSGSADSEPASITWTKEIRDDGCTRLRFEMPASLVPVFEAGTPSASSYWIGFDNDFMFVYTVNVNHLDLTGLTRWQYLKRGQCSSAETIGGKCTQANRINAKAYQEEPESNWAGADLGKDAICMNVDAVAPSNNDRSRFGVRLQFCGPKTKASIVDSVSKRMLENLEFSYLGCCTKANANLGGCKFR